MSDKTYRLSDATIGQIVQLVQMGILTGTDISDQIRTLRVVASGGSIEPDPGFVENFNKNLEKLKEAAINESGQT